MGAIQGTGFLVFYSTPHIGVYSVKILIAILMYYLYTPVASEISPCLRLCGSRYNHICLNFLRINHHVIWFFL